MHVIVANCKIHKIKTKFTLEIVKGLVIVRKICLVYTWIQYP